MKPAVPWTHQEVTRAKRAYEVQIELLMAGAPAGYWFAVRFDTGTTVKGDSAIWATKKAAVEWINANGGNANDWLFCQLPHDMIPRTWQSFAATLRMATQVEQYWRANSSSDHHLHMPTVPIVDAGEYGNA